MHHYNISPDMDLGIPTGSRIAVAMSGGVDSSVTALLLKEAGYDIFGVTMTLWSCHSAPKAGKQTCCSTADVADARAVCERIGIPHTVADFRTEFQEQVIENFVGEYRQGRTPIPCIGCNQYFKFDRLWTAMRDDFGAEYVATGHYSRIVRDTQGKAIAMQRGRDLKKDQSYYLFVMTNAQLQHSLFPLGELTKPEVRAMAARHGLATAEKPESFEICFVPDNDYAGFIEDYYPQAVGQQGNYLSSGGELLGRHQGTHAYTIGQRRGLGLGGGEKRYVTAINAKSGDVTLGSRDDLMRASLQASQMNWIGQSPRQGATLQASAKIRSQHTPAPCRLVVGESQTMCLEFDEPQSAITPGQAVVLYEGDNVLGGGWIQ